MQFEKKQQVLQSRTWKCTQTWSYHPSKRWGHTGREKHMQTKPHKTVKHKGCTIFMQTRAPKHQNINSLTKPEATKNPSTQHCRMGSQPPFPVPCAHGLVTSLSKVNVSGGREDSCASTSRTDQPTNRPTHRPTDRPTHRPTNRPTNRPTKQLTNRPTNRPTPPTLAAFAWGGNHLLYVLAYQHTDRPTDQLTNQPGSIMHSRLSHLSSRRHTRRNHEHVRSLIISIVNMSLIHVNVWQV